MCQGLVVPVVRDVEAMNFADIEKSLNELGEKVDSMLLLAWLVSTTHLIILIYSCN